MEKLEMIGFVPNESAGTKIPLFTMSVSAGTPVPVDSSIEKEADLNELLIKHPAATFFVRISGIDLDKAGIRDGDILIVDSEIQPHNGRLVICSLNDELTLKTFREIEGEVYLESPSGHFLPVDAEELYDMKIMGTVISVIHSL
ncbi:MAG: LexA family protein [Candidatus Kapaibacterium sp.]